MSRTIKTFNKTRSIEKALVGEKKFYAEYSSKVVIINDKPTRVPEYHVEWHDVRPLTDIKNKTPHFYYVATGERWESDSDIKYFLNRDKAEAYARELYEKYKDLFDDDYMVLITRVMPFND